MARKSLSRTLRLVAALVDLALMLARLHLALLLALGHIPGPSCVQREQSTLDQFVVERVNKLLCLQRERDTKTDTDVDCGI